MPKGVICGGAVDGSNQLGEIVTCQAMTTRPAGVAAIDGLALASAMATKNAPKARRKRAGSNKLIIFLPDWSHLYASRCFFGRNSRHETRGLGWPQQQGISSRLVVYISGGISRPDMVWFPAAQRTSAKR